jgi:nucleoside-diphosphate-sugar epimerase
MATTIFFAGASGAIGRRLVPLLLGAGHTVVGTTRSEAKAGEMERNGVRPVVVDVFDADALTACMNDAKPEVVMHQLTDLPHDFDTNALAAAQAGNARLRVEGTRNLVDAALQCGARRFVAQSIAWAFASGPEPHDDDDAIDALDHPAVAALERFTLDSPPLEGIVLRYGYLYGPGTWFDMPTGSVAVHVDAAAKAALLAVEGGEPGAYNIVESSAYASNDKAVRVLGWDPLFRPYAAIE